MGNADLFVGQYFFEKNAGSVNGYTDVNLQQARSFSSDSGLFFSERSIYTGFKQVNELAGGGTLFQQSLDNSLGFKYIKRFESGYSLKPRVGARNQLFRETSDEKWGKGLYDFWRYEAGLVWERKTRLGMSVPWTYQLSYDFYYTYYPRFKSLSNQFGAALASPDPGSRTLNAVTNQLAYRSDMDFPGFASAHFLYSLAFTDYTDQKVVNSQGEYLGSRRSDVYQNLGAGVSKRWFDFQALGRIRPVTGLGLSFGSLISNQNNFDTDPNRLKYAGGYYNYWEAHITPDVSLTFLKPMLNTRFGYDLGYRSYSGRLAQLADGAYTESKLRQFNHGVFIEASYPIVRFLDFKARGIWSSTNSNTKFEQTYKYNYSSYNYFAGLEWRL
ncbi:MAG: hypothetical protein A3J70_02230 [Elusimicrobia bacterium RIFCSPHIGHO2_02_FULL_61_10]|nr:MAG: hypothetical protein A3J70_02230 [Elusimicrobia bacterium RIFCSPHIGHO2_02_FULL_61_10]